MTPDRLQLMVMALPAPGAVRLSQTWGSGLAGSGFMAPPLPRIQRCKDGAEDQDFGDGQHGLSSYVLMGARMGRLFGEGFCHIQLNAPVVMGLLDNRQIEHVQRLL